MGGETTAHGLQRDGWRTQASFMTQSTQTDKMNHDFAEASATDASTRRSLLLQAGFATFSLSFLASLCV